MSFRDKMAELGLTEATLSRRVKERVKDYDDFGNLLKNLIASQKKETDPAKLEKIKTGITELKQTIHSLNLKLTSDVKRLVKNVNSYSKMTTHLKNGGKKKVTEKPAEKTTETRPPEPVVAATGTELTKETIPAAAPVATTEPPKEVKTTDKPSKSTMSNKVALPGKEAKPKTEPKKNGAWVGWALGGLAFFGTIVTFAFLSRKAK